MNDIQFKIDQLRKDKIIYAIESCAVTIYCVFLLFAYLMIEELSYRSDGFMLLMILLVVSTGYMIYMGIGNTLRLFKIKKLEKGLSNNAKTN